MPVTDTRATSVLPFDAFLTLLRARGYAVGLHEHLALAQLLRRWEGTNSPEFGDALAALIARNDDEIAAIRRLFDDVYAPPPPPPPSPPPPPLDPWGLVRRHAWSLAAAAALLVFALAVWRSFEPAPVVTTTTPAGNPPPGNAPPPPVDTTAAVTRPIDVPPPPAPEPPAPPSRLERRVAIPAGAGVFLVALAGFWALKARDVRRAWLRDAWSSALAALPGPYHFPLVIRDPVARLPRIDVEDAATILGRAITNEAHARQLDVRRTVRLTVRNGLMPSFVFKPRRTMHTILVVQDISEDMRVWRDKVDLFLTDLRRQGISLERHYFDADLRQISDAPHRATLDFDSVLRRRPNAPVLILSNGAGLAATLAASGQDAGWLRALGSRERRSWLTPVSDSRLWPAELDEVPLRVWPMTRRGLAQAARDLAGVDARPLDHVRARVLDEGRVSLDGIERMKRLASLVPYPTTDLLELLRRRFAPDVPDAVILHLLQDAGRMTAPVLRTSDAELKRCLSAVRFETPRLESQVRHMLLGILSESEPAPESAAHVRWEIANAVHRVALADLGEGSKTDAVATLDALGHGPMWEEVRAISRLTPGTPSLSREVASTLGGDHRVSSAEGVAGPPPENPPLREGLMPWTWPGVRELVPAGLAALILLIAGWQLGALPVRALEHVPDAYQLEFVPGAPPTLGAAPLGGALQLQRGLNVAVTVPNTVTVYQENNVFREGVDLSSGVATVPIGLSDVGKHYQVRTALPEGNLALSESVWVPDERIVVLIDALPWARVTFTGDQVPTGAQTTPFSAALKPGTYRLQLENGGLTSPLEQQITVRAPGGEGLSLAERTYRFTMPGFDPNQTATTLSGGR